MIKRSRQDRKKNSSSSKHSLFRAGFLQTTILHTFGPMMVINLIVLLFLHPIHVSVTEIEYSDKNKSLQITTRIFIDDLELSIRKQTKLESLDLLEPGPGMTKDQLVKAYLKEHFKVSIDGKPATINYLASEIE